jgi:hypothetical protein
VPVMMNKKMRYENSEINVMDAWGIGFKFSQE